MSNINRSDLKLYAITDSSWLGEKTLSEKVEEAICGGVTIVQLREKNKAGEELYEEALKIKEVCDRHSVPLIINDNVELAKRVDAAGVHLGQKDMNVSAARAILGPDKIIGVSARTVSQAVEAEEGGADYLGSGAVFVTGTKGDAMPLSHDVLSEICRNVSIPVVAIGGITAENAPLLKGTGVAGMAVVSAIFAKEDAKAAAMTLDRIDLKAEVSIDVEGVIFDMDGVILDSMKYWFSSPSSFLMRKGIKPGADVDEKLNIMTVDEGVRYLVENYNISVTKEELEKEILGGMLKNYATVIELKKGAKALIENLYEQGIPMVLATTSFHSMVDVAFERLGIRKYFKKVITSEDTGCSKRVPDMFVAAANELGVDPAKILVVEDTLESVISANQAGVMTVGVYDEISMKKWKGLRNEAKYSVEDMEHLIIKKS